MGVQVADQAEMVGGQRVHPDFFRVFGVTPVAGRPLNREDAQRSAVVSLGFAQRHFGSARGRAGPVAVGSGRQPHEIVGVMPAAMQFPAGDGRLGGGAARAQQPQPLGPQLPRRGPSGPGRPRWRPRTRELAALAAQLARAFPDSNGRKSFVALPLRDNLVGRVRATLFVMMARGRARPPDRLRQRRQPHPGPRVRTLARAGGARGPGGGPPAHRGPAPRGEPGPGPGRGRARPPPRPLRHATRSCGWARATSPCPRLDEVHIDWRVLLFTVAVSVADRRRLRARARASGLARGRGRGDGPERLARHPGRGLVAPPQRARGRADRAVVHAGHQCRPAPPLVRRPHGDAAGLPDGGGARGLRAARPRAGRSSTRAASTTSCASASASTSSSPACAQIPGVDLRRGGHGSAHGRLRLERLLRRRGPAHLRRRLPPAPFRRVPAGQSRLLPHPGHPASDAGGSSTTATSTTGRSWPSSASRWPGRASGAAIPSAIGSSAASTRPSG